jgi:hypothetical protein
MSLSVAAVSAANRRVRGVQEACIRTCRTRSAQERKKKGGNEKKKGGKYLPNMQGAGTRGGTVA